TRDEDATAISLREHRASVEAHAERRRMRSELGDRRHVLAAGVPCAKLVVRQVALMAIRKAEVLARLADAIELVVGQVVGDQVAAVVGEVELLVDGVEVEAYGVAHAERIRLCARAVGVEAANLRVAGRRLACVAGCTNADIELVVRTDRQKFPAMRAM